MTPIHTAVVDLLVSHGANIEEKDIDGLTPLDHAVINENKEIIEFLISHDANVNAK
ncbi:ankyrin repeat protein, putative [Trichomonas vaginalis G3]|uniref:Ankyrin repeat protein, putative n=1 Tax=Trichomonas vaginalis (strain ATCC PRA-98 / G3) TaxID=412133 RepID=A2DL18_TRIV3|nr:Ankyrin repeat family [Trichomonas vaginalis G3]EAY18971.1 ankyrin repeat protein, putative [Trichomonas vaginalis G3]KAI5532037.1 Ankyrin repeat family [Trichomonas vaginalis G3]|eukprot:XP_001579957.1 ankyrin repeat protein [Trichomonas vaginalis G3]